MANLLSPRGGRPDFPPFDPLALERLAARLTARMAWRVASACETDRRAAFESLSSELAELEESPDLVSVESLLVRLDELSRRSSGEGAESAAPRLAGVGDWLVYWPGRSMTTGEAEIASRGYFDVADRPPLGTWLAGMTRADAHGRSAPEVAILCISAEESASRIAAGREACSSGALARLGDVSERLMTELEVFFEARGLL